ncbi:hypothetical protein JCM8097_005111 [Rhodosporidiobolus ruineniae]
MYVQLTLILLRVHTHAPLPVQALTANASLGDRSPAYQRCRSTCEQDLCSTSSKPPPKDSPFAVFPSSSPLWSCTATCQYACQQHLTDLAVSLRPPASSSPSDPPPLLPQQRSGGDLEGLPAGEQVQFHGKWPFHRLDLTSTFPLSLPPLRWLVWLVPAAQEPLSVLFSLGNLWAHHEGLSALRRLSANGRMSEGKTLARVYAAYALSGLHAWAWSAVFHTRDVGWTERGDYYGAALTMFVGLWGGVVRLQGWYAPASKTGAGGKSVAPARRKSLVLFTLACAAVYALHVWYLARAPRFDYTYNMRFNVLAGLSTIALWALWAFRQSALPSPSNFSRRQLSSYPSARTRFRAPHYLRPLLPLVALPALTGLELLDFAPLGPFGLRLLDAHALWHLSTIAVVRAWYRFLVADVRWIDGQGEGGDPSSLLPGDSAARETGHGGAGVGGGGRGKSGVAETLLSGAALAKRRMTGLGAGLGLGIFGSGFGLSGESRRGSLAAVPTGLASGSVGLGAVDEGEERREREREREEAPRAVMAGGDKGARGE